MSTMPQHVPKPKQRNLNSADHLHLLELLADHEIKDMAIALHISESAVRGRIYRLRKHISVTQTFLNRVRTLQRNSRRVRKFTTLGSIPESLEKIEKMGSETNLEEAW